MSEGFKVTIFPRAIRSLKKSQITALEKTVEAVKSDLVNEQVLPFRKGHLQNDFTNIDISRSGEGIASITHSTPYARRLYYHPEYKFNKKENPNARGDWWEPWLTGRRKNFAYKAYAKFMKESSNGYIR